MYLQSILIMFCFSFSKSFKIPKGIINVNKCNSIKTPTPLFHSKHNDQNMQSKKAQRKTVTKEFIPKGPNQKLYFNYLKDPDTDIVLGVGPAGSGKTMFACYQAIQELMNGKIQKIIMTRPLVSVDKEDIGFLPGSLVNKMDPWTRPIFDILLEFFNQREITSMIQTGIIEISPLAYMRGRTFKNAFIIADEMQNSSPNQMLMMTTRIGEGTKMVITGDIKQSDREDENGLLDFMNKIKKYNVNNEDKLNKIKLVELEASDVERSLVVKKILKMYEPYAPVVPVVPVAGAQVATEAVPEAGAQVATKVAQVATKVATPPTTPTTKSTESISKILLNVNKTIIENDCAMIPLNQYKPI